MYYINKIVGWVMSPLGILFLGLLAGWLLTQVKRGQFKRLGRVVFALALVQMWVLSCGVTTRFIGTPLEGNEREVTDAELADVQAIVLLGGGIGIHEKCRRAELYGGADRAWMAARVWKRLMCAGKSPILTVSGGGAPGEIAFLADLGVATNRIVMLSAARNTEEEARMIRAKLEQDGKAKPKIALVSSAWHLPRAKVLFERVGFDVVETPTDYEMNAAAEAELRMGDFFPAADPLMRNSYAIKEWVARVGYALKR